MTLYRLGDQGSAVVEIRSVLLSLGLLSDEPAGTGRHSAERATSTGTSSNGVSAAFDAPTDQAVRAFQQQRGLIVDGIVGPATQRVLREASYHLGSRVLTFALSAPMQGDDVAALQAQLHHFGYYVGLVDGSFGASTDSALRTFQVEYGLTSDGICGPDTLRSLRRLGTRVTGGSPHAIREEDRVRRSGPQLSGKRIVIDPGPAARDNVDPELRAIEASIVWDVAARLEGRMAAAGMQAYLSRARDTTPSDAERAEYANSSEADLVISLRIAHHDTESARGVATFSFGNDRGSESAIGKSLAGYIQREIVARTGLPDCRSHGRTWEILKLTRMPVAVVDMGYITSPRDREMLSDPQVRDTIADAILVAVKRVYLLGKNDRPTGTYTFADLLASEQLAY